MTPDGRNASIAQTVTVQTHDVAITRLMAPRAGHANRSASIRVRISNKLYAEYVQVDLFKSLPGGNGFESVGSLVQYVPVGRRNRTTLFKFRYRFTADDAYIGKVSFRAVATILSANDALPADNELIAAPTAVRP